jgi:hypothetical protein
MRPSPPSARLIVDPGLRADNLTHPALEAHDAGVAAGRAIWPPRGCAVQGADPSPRCPARQALVDGFLGQMPLHGLRQAHQQLGVSKAETAVLDRGEDRGFQPQDPEEMGDGVAGTTEPPPGVSV